MEDIKMANYEKVEQLYEGKAKKVFKTNVPGVVIVDYKDDATAFNGEKKVQSWAKVLSITRWQIIS